MSSRFVSARDEQTLSPTADDWEKARLEVESKRSAKVVEPGKQEGGKSLYEVLQANKAAKQEAFEEASKLRNQFRPLDDSEIEYLDSVRDAERAQQDSLRQETSEQLDQFRKQQTAAELAARDLEETTTAATQDVVKERWTTSKKRRRRTIDGDDLAAKMRKPPDSPSIKPPVNDHKFSTSTNKTEHKTPSTALDTARGASDKGGQSVLGLSAYDSDED